MKYHLLLKAIGLVLFLSCSKTTTLPQSPSPKPELPIEVNKRESGSRSGTDKADRPYNLNIVYFVPKDLDTLVGYEKRLDEMMLWGQQWFHDKMKLYSYDKTFGLLTNDQKTKVRITTIYGTKTSSQYTLEGGAKPIWDEIEAYYKAHPQERLSDHFLNIVPRYSFKVSGEPTGPPYHGATYGKNRTCFVLDYEDMEMKNMDDKTDKGKWFRLYYGGLLHELGHALNLPHNMQTVSELNDPNKGSSMMHIGNYTLGTKPTFLTPADCEMLSVNQLFNKEQKEYYGAAKARITEITGNYDQSKGAIILSGKYETDIPITGIAVYNDPQVNNEGIGTNKDYNAVSFATKPLNGNRFYLEMPVTDFTYRNNEDYEIKIFLIHENGIFSNAFYSYRFVNNLPVLNISTRTELSKADWSIDAFSSEESGEGKALAAIDQNLMSYWHSRWSSNATVYPHSLTINVGSTAVKAKGLVYHARPGAYRHSKNFEVQISDDGTNFTSAGEFQTIYSQGPQYFHFNSEHSVKSFKIILKSSWDGTGNAAIAELGLY